jgi:hypothetical protein
MCHVVKGANPEVENRLDGTRGLDKAIDMS